MRPFDPNAIETLLNMSEGAALDFKRDQYPLAGATDIQKAELVKDVVAFANAWKTTDAHILIGVDEAPGKRATVVGVAAHLDDADIQQLVNSKTNTPISFEYLAVTVDGLPIGVLRVDQEQQRPLYLRKGFGQLKSNVVYVRRGSSTSEADPTEIAKMGHASAMAAQEPQVDMKLADPELRQVLGIDVHVTSKRLRESPPHLLDSLIRKIEVLDKWSRPDPKKLAAHRKELALLGRLGFCATNTGRLLLEDARIMVDIPKHEHLRLFDELPERPRGPLEAPVSFAGLLYRRTRTTTVHDDGDRWRLDVRLGKIQAAETVWSIPFWIGSLVARDLDLVARVSADNISIPIEVPFRVSIEVTDGVFGPKSGAEDEGIEGH
jgi:hypothetical protein